MDVVLAAPIVSRIVFTLTSDIPSGLVYNTVDLAVTCVAIQYFRKLQLDPLKTLFGATMLGLYYGYAFERILIASIDFSTALRINLTSTLIFLITNQLFPVRNAFARA